MLTYTTTKVTITTGGTAQDLIGATPNRKFLNIVGDSGNIGIVRYDFGTTATNNSIPENTSIGNLFSDFPDSVLQGDNITGQSVSILNSQTGDIFYVIEGV